MGGTHRGTHNGINTKSGENKYWAFISSITVSTRVQMHFEALDDVQHDESNEQTLRLRLTRLTCRHIDSLPEVHI